MFRPWKHHLDRTAADLFGIESLRASNETSIVVPTSRHEHLVGIQESDIQNSGV